MWIEVYINDKKKRVNLNSPIDISIPLKSGLENPIAWYVKPPKIEAQQIDDWVGAVNEGASVNFNKITFNPHAHGTHTCLLYTSPSPRDQRGSRMPSSA